MPEAIIIGGPLDGRRIHVANERPMFLEAPDEKGDAHMHFEVSVVWLNRTIDEPLFVHSSMHRDGFDLMQVLLAGYRRPGA